ncbi:MAG: hypothetical protein ACLUHE_00150 [Christensenellales bacterium]
MTAEGALPQGGRGRLETDGESVTISAADGNGGLQDDHLRMGRGDAERAEDVRIGEPCMMKMNGRTVSGWRRDE